jgi:hypothetical protein
MLMSISRLAGNATTEAHICDACARPFVYPDFGVEEGSRWRVLLHCQSCGWSAERLLDDEALERFERAVDADRDKIVRDLARFTHHNMREYYDRFAAALAADAILPEDF